MALGSKCQMSSCGQRVAVLLGAIFLSATVAHAQDHSFLPGSAWGLVLPDGFAQQDMPVPHFSHPDRAYIVVQELYETLDEQGLGPVGTSFGEGAHATKIVEFEDLQTANGRMLLWSGRNVSSGDVTLMAFAEGPGSIASLTAVVTDGSSVEPASLRAALTSVTRRSVPEDERLAVFPVVVRDLAGFRIARFAPDTMLLTQSGAYTGHADYEGSSITIVAKARQPSERLMIPETIATMRDMVESGLPEGRQTGSEIIQTGLGQAVVTRFVFSQPTGRQFAGKTITMTSRCCLLIAVGAYPPGEQDAQESFRRIWQSIRSRN